MTVGNVSVLVESAKDLRIMIVLQNFLILLRERGYDVCVGGGGGQKCDAMYKLKEREQNKMYGE